MKRIKKALVLFATMGLAASVFAQEATDGFVVPLDEDFSKVTVSAPSAEATGAGRNVKQGIYIKVTSSNKSLIRDIAKGEKKGYEFDSSHFLSEANWWFWGDISPSFHLDAEIAAWKFDKTLYQANSYADNVPAVTWGDGLQTLASMPFSWIANANDNGIGAFNKMGFSIITPWVDAKLGYGNLKANGMLDWKGIYHVIDRWNDVGKGFTEISLGRDLRQHGNVTINATAALSRMRGTYGVYDLLDVKYGEDEKNPFIEGALTFGSMTTAEELFRYNEANKSAMSAYFAVAPLAPLKLEVHGMGTFGTGIDLDKDALAIAGRIGWKADKWSASIMESYAQKNVNSVWGSDGTNYDNINANKATTQLDVTVSPEEMFSFGLDQGVSIVLNSETSPNKHNQYKDFISFRTQPYADIDLSSLINKDIAIGLYGVVTFDKIAEESKTDKDLETTFKEAGIELRFGELAKFLKKMTFDYAVKANAKWEMTSSTTNSYEFGEMYHSFMLGADITENFNINGGAVYRHWVDKEDKQQPLGFAFGFAFNRTPLPGHPKFWVHATYGMDPYEDNNYSVYRADHPDKKLLHRTYLLNSLSTNMTYSFIRMGLIWDLQ
ncbi:MAG: hypothetical protein IJS09_06250 [Treponema sp.]|nr:hypothetical protein [Treponema sp.]